METRTGYLVDTNIWLERLLEQENSSIAAQFFELIPPENLFVSDFTIHSIGVILSKYKKYDTFERFITDLFITGQIGLLSLDSIELFDVIKYIKRSKFDFDDSYQFTVAEKYDLTLVTFDKDFNTEGVRKKTPNEILEGR